MIDYSRLPAALLAMALALPLTFCPAHADDDDELDRLRDAVGQGTVLPLSQLQAKVRQSFPGEIIRVELDEDDDRFVYQFKVLQANGRLVEIEMDAHNGRILDIDDEDDED